MHSIRLFLCLLLASAALIPAVSAADNVWVGNDNQSNGAWSRTGNWTNNTSPNFQTNNRIVFQNNLTSTNMLYDLGGWVSASDIVWDPSFNVSRTLSSTGGGIDFATRLENNSSYTQTVSMNLSGGKFGAGDIQLNPVNGDLVINGTIYNDRSLSYNIWGNTGRTLTLNSTLGPNATQSSVNFTIQRNATVQVNTNQLWQGTTTLNGGTLNIGTSGLMGNGTYTGAVALNSYNGTNSSLVLSNSRSQIMSGAISGTGALIQSGTGTTTLSGNNTFSGGTIVNAGTLALSNNNVNVLTGPVTVNSGATLRAQGVNIISDTSAMTLNGGTYAMGTNGEYLASLTMNGNSTVSGTPGVGGAQFILTAGQATNSTIKTLTATGANNLVQANIGISSQWGGVGGNANLNFNVVNATDSLAVSGVIADKAFDGGGNATSGAITKSGQGTLILTGDNTYSGGASILGGTIQVGNGGTTGNITGNSATILNNGTLIINRADGFGLGNLISGSGALIQAGVGTTTVSANNTYTGGTVVSRGSLKGSTSASFGTGTIVLGDANTGTNNISLVMDTASGTTNQNAILVSGLGSGNVAIGGTNTGGSVPNVWAGQMTLNTNVQLFANNTTTRSSFTGKITGAGGVTITQGRVTIDNTNNDYAGSTTVNSGAILQLNGNEVLPNSTSLTVNGSLYFASGGSTETISSLSGNGTVQVHPSVSGSYTIAVSSASNSTFGGVIANGGGTVAFTKAGSGTQVLSGNNTYTGATTVSGGRLTLSGTSSSSGFSIASNSVLEFNVGGGTNDSSSTTFTGSGILQKTGAGRLMWGTTAANFALSSGSMIDVQGGVLIGGSSANETWTSNQSSLNVASGATFAGVEANVRVDALTGAGTISSGNNGNGYSSFTFGVAGGSGTFSGTLANTDGSNVGNFTKAGSGTQVLAGTNTYNGTTTVSGGTLQVGNGGTSGTLGSGNVVNNASLVFNRSDAATVGNTISGTGSLTQVGSGTTTLSGANTYSGTTTISAGTLQVGNGGTSGTLGSGNVVNNSSLLFNRNDAATVGNAISGTGSLVQAGSGTTTLSGNNTYTGGTFVNGGTLALTGSLTNSASAAITVNNGGTFLIAKDNFMGGHGSTILTPITINAGGLVSGGTYLNTIGALNLNGGTLTSTGGNSYWGNLAFVLKGTVTTAGDVTSTIGGSGAMMLGGDTVNSVTFSVANGLSDTDLLVSAVLDNGATASWPNRQASSLVKTGDGKMVLAANNTYTGTTTISGGTLQVGNGGTSGALGSGNVTNSGTLSINRNNAYTLGSVISGTGSLIQAGTGTTTLTAANSYSGGTVVNAGVLQATTESQLGASNGAVTLNGGQLMNNNSDLSLNSNRAVTLGSSGGFLEAGWNRSITVAGQIGGSGGLGVVWNAGTVILSGSNSYAGTTTIGTTGNGFYNNAASTPTLRLGNANALPSMGLLVFGTNAQNNTATLDLNGFSASVGGLSGSGNARITNTAAGAATLTLAPSNSSATFGGIIGNGSGALSLVKNGSGTQTLSGNNTYTGLTTVNGGRLVVANATSSSSYSNSATLEFNASGSVIQLSGGTLSGTGTLVKTGTNALWLGASGKTEFINLSAGALIDVQGGLLRNEYFAGNWTSNRASLNVASGALVDLWDSPGGIIVDSLTGAGTVSGGYSGPNTLSVGVANGSGTFSGMLVNSVPNSAGQTNGILNLTKQGTGTQVLTGTNTYSGTTTISGGTLQVGNGGTTGTLGTGNVTNNSSLVLNRSDAATVGNTISGSGALTHAGAGTTTLSGSNTYTGSTTISGGGALALSSTGTLSGSTNINLGTTNSRGTLDVSAKGASGYTFGTNQQISGNGTITTGATNRTVTLNGTLKPGNSIGTVAVNGNLTLGSTAQSIFELGTAGTFASPGQSDRTTVTGNLTLGGSLSLLDNANQNGQGVMGPGVYRLFTYGGSLAGNFTNTPPSLMFSNALYRPSLVTATLGVVDLNIAQLAAGSFFTNAISLAYHVTNSGSVSTTLGISNTVAAGGGSLGVSLVSNSGTASLTGGTNFTNLAPGASTNMILSVAKSAVAGVTTGTALFAMNDTGVGGGSAPVSLGSNSIAYTATGYNLASAALASTNIDLGRIHAGGTFGTTNLSLGNSASNSAFTETLGASLGNATGGASGSGSVTGLAAGSSDTSLSVTLTNTTAGAKSATIALNLNSEAINNSGLGNTSLGSQTVNVTGFVYSGQGVWRTNGGSWSDFGNWQQAGGVAGIDGALSANDTATFGAGGSGSVTLDGTAPYLQSITFSNSSSSYEIAQGSGGGLTLQSGNTNASLNVQAGSHSITATVNAASDITLNTASDSRLTLGGSVSGVGGLNQTGSGTTILSASNSYTGLTKVSGGTLAVNGSIAGDLQVDAGATLKGSGTIAGDTTISGTHSPGNSPGIQTFGGNLTYQPGSSMVWQLAANTTTNSPLVYDQVIVGGNLAFNGSTTLQLVFNDLGSMVNWTDALWSSNQIWTIYQVSGQTTGLENFTISPGSLFDAYGNQLDSIVAGASFSISQNGQDVTLTYTVPEPSTYALIGLGALALVVAYRRRRRRV